MFKFESYITPILLRYVDKYIQNFKPQDSQVSLWGGAATFNNLDLRLDVLEQELQIPFCFVSGHIHELQIRVPWTKITTEPIVITINTIECVLKLRGANYQSEASPKPKTPSKKDEDVEAVPPSYASSLINKIVNNIQINCNNLILKYVEDDIVLSMNVKLLTVQSANAEWKPEYSEFSSSLITLRKLITLSDLTVCIDKRNAAGKIDVYLEPILYKCFIEMHLLRIYHTATAKISSTTRLDVYCNRMEFSITEQQVPMAMRILMLLIALQQHELKYLMERTSGGEPDSGKYAESENNESWVGWAWSFVPSLPLSWDDDWTRSQEETKGHTLHIGGYIDMATVTFKLSESSVDHSGYYPQKKMRCAPVLMIKLQGCYMETIMHGLTWFNVQGGISEVSIIPIGFCTCSYTEINEGESVSYLTIGAESDNHKKDSLFDAQAPENLGERRGYNIVWDTHIEVNTENALLERTPAVAMDYVYQLEIPDDYNLDNVSDLSSVLEYSNLVEKSLCQFFVSPFKLCLCSGLFHRITSLKEAAASYDYPPYGANKPDPELKDLHPPSEEDFDALSIFIPRREYSLFIRKAVIEFQLMDHPYFRPRKGYLFKRQKRVSTTSFKSVTASSSKSTSTTDLPKLTLECDKFQIKYNQPMYPKRLIQTTCQLPNPPTAMFDACHANLIVALTGLSSRLIVNSSNQTTLVMPANITYTEQQILKPHYWINVNTPLRNITFQADSFGITGTKAKILLAYAIINSIIKVEDVDNLIMSNSLIVDAGKSYGMVLLEFCLESIKYRKITTMTTVTHLCSVLAVKAFVIEPPESMAAAASNTEVLQVLILSGPESSKFDADVTQAENKSSSLCHWLFQCPLTTEAMPHAPIVHFHVSEIQICFDPLFFKWLLYIPKRTGIKSDHQSFDLSARKHKNPSEASGSLADIPRRFGTPHESVHSSSDPTMYLPTTSKREQNDTERDMDFQESVYNFLMEWISVWRVLIIDGTVSKCIIYFPIESLSAVGYKGIQDAVKNAIDNDPNAEFLVIRLPKAVISSHMVASAQHTDTFADYLGSFPIDLPPYLWNADDFTFPWTLSVTDFCCYTVQYGKQFDFLHPVSMKATLVLARQIAPKYKFEEEVVTREVSSEDLTAQINSRRKVNFNERVAYDRPSNVYQLSGPTLGVCVHIDTSNTSIAISEVQVCVIASVLYGLINVGSLLFHSSPDRKQAPKCQDLGSIVSEPSANSFASSPGSLGDKTGDAESTASIAEPVKLTALVQWTSARFRVKILSHDADDLNSRKYSYKQSPKLKLVFDAEDLMASLDFQHVYLKVKGKIAAASVKHYVLRDGRWVGGPFLGVVMQVREESVEENKLDTDDFCSITITRASCEHAYILWGTPSKYKLHEQTKEDEGSSKAPIRFMTEVVTTLRPIDIILSMMTLRSYYLVIEPLLNIPHEIHMSSPHVHKNCTSHPTNFSNFNLPLAYFECTGIRVIVPSLELVSTGNVDNTVMFEIKNIKLSPNAVNPICRTPYRPDIYQKAAKKRILHIPGSEVEDRQYQLDITGIVLTTASWYEIKPVLMDEGYLTHKLKTMSENPALEWNNLDESKGNERIPEQLNSLSVFSRYNLNIVMAPAIMYNTELVCGHSIEVNFVSDINVTLSLKQIKLASNLYVECCDVFKPILSDTSLRPKILFLYEQSLSDVEIIAEAVEEDDYVESSSDIVRQDSGIDTNDSSSNTNTAYRHRDVSTFVSEFENSLYKNRASLERSSKSHSKLLQVPENTSVPIDVLITAGKINFILYEIERPPNMPTATQKKKPKLENYIPNFLRVAPKEVNIVQSNTVSNINMKKVFPQYRYSISEEQASTSGATDRHGKRVADWKSKIVHVPLMFLKIVQPNIFLSQTKMGNSGKISIFNVKLGISGPEYPTTKKKPVEPDFPIIILETKRGHVNPDTGIPPAFFMFKLSSSFGQLQTVDVTFGRPTRILCSLNRWNDILIIYERVIKCCLKISEHNKKAASLSVGSVVKSDSSRPRSFSKQSVSSAETFTKYREMKERLYGVTELRVKTVQIVISERTNAGAEVGLSFAELHFLLSVQHKPERIQTTLNMKSVTLSVYNEEITRLLLQPWTCHAHVLLFWELWQSVNSDPQIRVSAESDPIVIDLGPEHLKALEIITQEIQTYKSYFKEDDADSLGQSPGVVHRPASVDKEQHYKDDLRAGAYQFVDAAGGENELPQTYQVKFWSKNISAMAWRYPQPRALTKVRVFPVPFKLVSNSSGAADQQVTCNLEYWSECHKAYRPYTHFYLSESEMCHLELPQMGSGRGPIASIWRVIMHRTDDEPANTMISARALAVCMRIDSYFNKSLVPNITALVRISNINVSLFNYFQPTMKVSHYLPPSLKHYNFDGAVPENQCFLTFSLQNTKLYSTCWQYQSLLMDFTTNVRCSILDYGFLTMEPFLQPFNLKVDSCFSDTLAINVAVQPVHVRFGPSIAHTLAVSTQMWEQTQLTDEDIEKLESLEIVVMTRYVICNNTNVPLKFGQAHVDEEISLRPRFCHFYCWRTQKVNSLSLHVATDEPGYINWSVPFSIDREGTEALEISSNKSLPFLMVNVTKISATQHRVTFSGQLFIANLLKEIFEMKLVLATAPNRDIEFKTAQTHVIANGFAPSMIINSKEKYSLRLRFYALEAPWSGDIPLEENAKCLQPWLVKIPLQERGQFLSIWCRVVKQKISANFTKVLVMLWPLFMMRSHLPVPTEVVMETPKLKLHLTSKIKGQGELEQLYCPGTINLTHNLSFETESGNPTAEAYIPLHYGQVDQSKFFQKLPGETIADILKVLETYADSDWPYLGEDFKCIDWLIEEQPVANLQIQYKNACPHSSALCLELLPWCLMVNTLGSHICLVVNGERIASLRQHAIISPPRIEETFHIGINADSKMFVTPPLQFAKNESTDSFFMPKITGLLPVQGLVKTSIRADNTICALVIDSSVIKDIRIIRISSTHVFTNFMSESLRILCFAVPETNSNVPVPKAAAQYSFNAEPRLNKQKSGVPICSWLALGDVDTNSDFAMYISVSIDNYFGFSCPVRVDKVLLRRSIYIPLSSTTIPAAVTVQEYKGQIYVGVHSDSHPQLLLNNSSEAQLFFAQIGSATEKTVVKDCEHFNWVCSVEKGSKTYYTMPSVSEKFPDITAQNGSVSNYFLVMAVAPDGGMDGGNAFEWSTPVSITNFNDQFVRIPKYGEVKVTVTNSSHATVVDIESASQVEICARDVRGRLSNAAGKENIDNNPPPPSVQLKQKRLTIEDKDGKTFPASKSSIGLATKLDKSIKGKGSQGSNEQQPKGTPTSTTDIYKDVSFLSAQSEMFFPARDVSFSNVTPEREVLIAASSDIVTSPSKRLVLQLYASTISFTLVNDLRKKKEDIAALIFDNLVLTAEEEEKLVIIFSASNIQFDNRLYSKGIYDFPVVLINQEWVSYPKEPKNCFHIDDFRDLIKCGRTNSVITVTVDVETWPNYNNSANVSLVKEVRVELKPVSAYVEDRYVTDLVAFFEECSPHNLVVWAARHHKKSFTTDSFTVCVPDVLIWQANVLANPLALRSLTIEPITVSLSVHSSVKMYIALDQSPLTFAKFDRKGFITTPYKLGHALTVHFLSGAIFRAGWVVGSLELLGSPGGLARAMGSGLKDFVNLPYRGLLHGPWAFLKGITHGSASLMRHITAGTLHSVTQFASSVARNLDRLTLDEEHLRRTEEQRRQRPHGLADGLWQGMTSFGVSLLGAVAGIAHHPMQSVITGNASPGELAAGVGLGLVGVFIKPLGGAAEFLALTGQGLLEGAGWNTLPAQRAGTITFDIERPENCALKFNWKYAGIQSATILFSIAASSVSNFNAEYEPVELIVTNRLLMVVNTEADVIQRAINLLHLEEVTGGGQERDTTLLCFRFQPVYNAPIKVDPETETVEMDPVSRARVADYVKNTAVLVRFPSTETSPVHSEMSISSSGSVSTTAENLDLGGAEPVLRFHVNPQFRDYFYNLVKLLKRQSENDNFPVL